jgi:hypothetical protein
VQSKRSQAEFSAQVAGHDVDQRRVPAVGIVENEFSEAGLGQAGSEVPQHGHERSGAERECSRETDVLVALAVMHGRQGVDGQIGGQFAQRVSEQQIVDQRVGGQGQVMPVLFDRRGGKNQKRGLTGKRIHLLPIQVREISRVRNPGFHFVVAPAVADSE